MTRPKLGIPRRAVYPPLVAVAFVFSQFGVSNVPIEALARPAIAAFLLGLAIYGIASGLMASFDRGALVATVILLVLMGLAEVAVVLVGWLLIAVIIAVRRGRGLRLIPWLRATRILNGVAAILLVVTIAATGLEGAFNSPAVGSRVPRGTAQSGAPDLYLIMLDGYPRSDTLASKFDFDNAPFLDSMEGMGFDVAAKSHSNYDSTLLTLASMMNGRQVPSLVPDPPTSVPDQFRLATRLINQGSMIDEMRSAGYEIVTLPSGYLEAGLLSADRVIDSGELTTFETQLLLTGGTRTAIGGIERSWLPDQHRSRIFSTFEALDRLAAEHGSGPKLVFAHVMAPHLPIAFDAEGGPVEPWPCFPASCTLFSYPAGDGSSISGPMRNQISWLNSEVEEIAQSIKDKSTSPPIIVIFSDHGTRYDPSDRDEMFRNLFLALTPDRSNVFPEDVSPVNVLRRLLNAYSGSEQGLSSEESYWLDDRLATVTGLFGLQPQEIRD